MGLGDVFHRAFKKQQRSIVVAYHVGVFQYPDGFAGFVPVNLGAEVEHLPVVFDQLAESAALARIDIPFPPDVVHGQQHFGFGRITVEPHQCGVGAQLTAIGTGSVSTYGQ